MNVVLAALSAPAQLNGVSRHAVNLARALLCQSRLNSLHFMAGAWQKEMYRDAFLSNNPHLHFHWVSLPDTNWSRLAWYYRDLPHIAGQLEADIVHLAYPAPIASGMFPCPTVLSLHDFYPFDIPRNFGFMKAAFARHIVRRCISAVDSIACVSASTRTQLERWAPRAASKSLVIPNVVELPSSVPYENGLIQLEGRNFILCVAQHRRNKNVALSVQVFDRLLREQILPVNARLAIVGIPGPETHRILKEIRKCRLSGKVLLYTGLSDSELRWCYENCSALLAPSSIEGFGLPIAEAMLSGCRIVCSDIPAFREVGDAGCQFVSPDGDAVEAYAKALRETLASARPAPSMLPQFSPHAIGRRYIDLYRDLTCSGILESDMLRQPESAATALFHSNSPSGRG